MDNKPILIVCDEREALADTAEILRRRGLRSTTCSTVREALVSLDRQDFSAVFCHDTLPDGDYRAVVTAAKPTPTIVLSRLAEWDLYLKALRAGAFDYIACPPSAEETERILKAAMEAGLHPHLSQSAA